MKTKVINQLTIYGVDFETSLKEIGQLVGETPTKLAEQIAAKGLQIIAPQQWIYIGMDGNPDTKFKLPIAFPIADSITNNDKNIRKTDEFEHISHIHKGSWSEFPSVYGNLIQQIYKSGLKLSNQCREIYHTVDFEKPENNVTEILIGIEKH